MRLILIGFMGAGKTTVAKLLGAALGFEVIELDDLITRRSGRSAITEIFEVDGESRFRQLEAEVAKSAGSFQNCVVSCGGGIVTDLENIKALKGAEGTVVFLDTGLELIFSRLEVGAAGRPLFRDRPAIEELYRRRLPLYRLAADCTILTDGKAPLQVADEILQFLKHPGANSD